MIPLLFGEVSAGLRQKCLRKILYSILFEDHPGTVCSCEYSASCFSNLKASTSSI